MSNEIQIPKLGYFDDPSQTEPAYDPGPDAICPFCGKVIGNVELALCHSLMLPGDNCCYFYRYHKDCTDYHKRTVIDDAIIDAAAMGRFHTN